MLPKGLTEKDFINTISLIASKHGCRIVDIDLAKRIINLDGPPEAEMACILELEEVLRKYMENKDPAENDGFYGWHEFAA
ncbi:MAG: hypothetical protein KKH84_05635 [Proteobacteria bacterium]|nr:hypothetical protein [Pseudomonadota bacterium]MBU4208577.1 hypothetical protein [Pseudomonadota bacterium]MBU4420472.1 hypothetical protein [Pseudomonadota bacterium]